MSREPADDWRYWRDLAKTTRAKINQMKDNRSKRMLRALAAGYERAAQQIEKRLYKTKEPK
jgi:hypothetical protein